MTDRNSQPVVAIITRTKNRVLFLERAIQSVEKQTYQNYIHVILNDGGEPNGVDRLHKKYPNKRRIVLHNKQSVGIVKAMNQAIRAVDSAYIVSLDDDDYWSENLLQLCVDTAQRNNSAVVTFLADIVEESIKNNAIIKENQYHYKYSSWSGEITLFKQICSGHLATGIIMQRRSVYNELGGYDESLESGEDWDYGIRLLMKYDVDRVQSEDSLMFYSKRKKESGDSLNITQNTLEKSMGRLRNKYLRQDLERGALGVGYIMNNAEYDLLNVIRLEGHINYSTDTIRHELSYQKIDMVRFISKIKQILRAK